MQKIEFQEEIKESSIIPVDFNTLLPEMDRSSRQKICVDIAELNSAHNQLDTMDMPRLIHPTAADYTFFSDLQGSFTKIYHILGHKAHLTTLKE